MNSSITKTLAVPSTALPSMMTQLPEGKRKIFGLLMESLLALRRENKEVLWSSMIKDTMKRKKPSFNEEYHGYRTFSELLEDASRHGLLDLETHKTSGTYVVTRFGSEPRTTSPAIPKHSSPPPINGPRAAAPSRHTRVPVRREPPPPVVPAVEDLVDDVEERHGFDPDVESK